jgi:hypothetical protein
MCINMSKTPLTQAPLHEHAGIFLDLFGIILIEQFSIQFDRTIDTVRQRLGPGQIPKGVAHTNPPRTGLTTNSKRERITPDSTSSTGHRTRCSDVLRIAPQTFRERLYDLPRCDSEKTSLSTTSTVVFIGHGFFRFLKASSETTLFDTGADAGLTTGGATAPPSSSRNTSRSSARVSAVVSWD